MPKYGRVYFNISYVVDLDNEEMVNDARQCVFEDVMSAVKYDEVADRIKVKEDPAANPADIPEFLTQGQKENEVD